MYPATDVGFDFVVGRQKTGEHLMQS